jgi:Na+-transporting NADH:ubiquinone oxidoreductase subunit C
VHSTSDVIKFVVGMTFIVAVILALMATGLKDIHAKNEAVFNKRAILNSVNPYLPKPVSQLSDDEVEELFSTKIVQKAFLSDGTLATEEDIISSGYPGGKPEFIDMGKERKKSESARIFPLFVYNTDQEAYYIASVRGSGLWDEIWANVAVSSDFNTIAGISFDHKGETPGLGAEIKDNPSFAAQFVNTQLFSKDGNFKSVRVAKGKAMNTYHEVDGISGATITCDGVSDMMYAGMKKYTQFFEVLKEN